MLPGKTSRKLPSIANLIGERGEMAKQPLPVSLSGSQRSALGNRYNEACFRLQLTSGIVITSEAKNLLFSYATA